MNKLLEYADTVRSEIRQKQEKTHTEILERAEQAMGEWKDELEVFLVGDPVVEYDRIVFHFDPSEYEIAPLQLEVFGYGWSWHCNGYKVGGSVTSAIYYAVSQYPFWKERQNET